MMYLSFAHQRHRRFLFYGLPKDFFNASELGANKTLKMRSVEHKVVDDDPLMTASMRTAARAPCQFVIRGAPLSLLAAMVVFTE